jgi:hypothetical protein
MKKMFKTAGYVILALSGLLWGLILVVPWLGFSTKEIAGIMTILIIGGEITFYLSILILGKSIYVKIKNLKEFMQSISNINTLHFTF